MTILDDIKEFLVPAGGIVGWHPPEPEGKTKVQAPEGWAICDGTSGTPDLTDRFIRGPNREMSNVGTGGGKESHDHSGSTGTSNQSRGCWKGTNPQMTQPEHRHSIGGDTNLPPFLVLVYIMKL